MSLPPDLSFSERRLLEDACAAFEHATRRFKARPTKRLSARERPALGAIVDGAISFNVNGKNFDMPVFLKERAGETGIVAARALLFPDKSAARQRQFVFVTRYLTPGKANDLISRGVRFLDTAGNVFLDEPEATIMITGRPKPSPVRSVPSARSTTPKGLRVMFAIATTPGLVTQPYRTIAESAGVALNTVNMAVDDLMARGLVAEKRDGERILPDWQRFVDEWVSLYPSQLRHKLGTRRFASASPDWWRSFDFAKFTDLLDLRLGGEVAAEDLTHQLKASRTTIYTQSPVTSEFILKARLRPDDFGDVEILEAFWPRSSVKVSGSIVARPLVHPLLVYADLVATGDSRNLSVASQIYDEHLATLQA
ncbi:type IV toxin-antitoxin system AbiEi family antitoxin [Paraburkholderia sp. HP33-1]|uniref:type IV toxin-antitoxin system AbiEi family antitoxin n=1 Tax=Paraburkholderia sp. HP33-1 TaxID=2883243 RepID=UPI001F21DAA1|nr:type IV toxin-antitoxin system AbiEi family antitoxin [Paraburkholderia sp. HP33-1]